MPRVLETYTECAGPGVARSHRNFGGFVGAFIDAFYAAGYAGAGAFFSLTVGITTTGLILVFGPTPAGYIALIAYVLVVIGWIAQIKYWYYNERLLCIQDPGKNQCVIGTVISYPDAARDGDRKLNLLVAPFDRSECVEKLVEHLKANKGLLETDANFRPPFHTARPEFPSEEDLADVTLLRDYVRALRGSEQPRPLQDASADVYDEILIGVVDRLMSDDNVRDDPPVEPKNFFNRFYRKDEAVIDVGSPLWEAIPDDFDVSVDWAYDNASQSVLDLNPVFRFDDSKKLVPFLHCEIEGNRLGLILDRLILALMAFLTVLGALLVLSTIAVAGAVFFAVVIAIMAYFGLDILDERLRDGGIAEFPDVENLDLAPNVGRPGDLVVVYGRWVMDTEHEEYFEIHPVRAYYLVFEAGFGGDPGVAEPDGQGNFPANAITRQRAAAICAMVEDAEEGDLPGSVERSLSEALSYGLRTRYGGGGVAVR